MSLGLTIGDNKVVWLGQMREELIHSLESEKINFKIMFDRVNEDKNIKETIVSVPSLNMEISLENDIITYIKTKASEYTILKNVNTAHSNMQKVNDILDAVRNYFGIKDVSISDLNISNFDIRVIVREDYFSYRIHIMTTQKGESFIYTMKVVKEK